jgi:hypothetical protein
VIDGKTITLDGGTTFVADGTRVILHLTLDPVIQHRAAQRMNLLRSSFCSTSWRRPRT